MVKAKAKAPRRGEIHWVSMPAVHAVGTEYRDSDSGMRPWVIVSDINTQKGGVVIAVPLTSNLNRIDDPGASDFRVRVPAEGVTQVSLDRGTPSDSIALCDHLRSLSVKRIQSRLGKLKHDILPLIEAAIRNAMGFDD